MVRIGIPWDLHGEIVCEFRLPPQCPEDRAVWLRRSLRHLVSKYSLPLNKAGRVWLDRLESQNDKAD